MAHLHTTHVLDTVRKSAKKHLDTVVADTYMETLLMEIKDAKAKIKKFQEEERLYKKLLEREIDGAKVILNDKGVTLATWNDVIMHRFDTDGFKKDHMDLYEEYLKESHEPRLLIK